MRVGGVSLKKKPIDGCTASGFPLGCMWSCTTRSVPGSRRQARSPSTSGAIWPGVQPRKWPSGYSAERASSPS